MKRVERVSLNTGFGRTLSVLMVLTLLASMVGSASAYQRKPLFEDFTSTTCPPCANLAPIQEAALEQCEGEVVVIAYHMNWPAPGNDPWCADNPVDNLQPGRRQYYGVNGVPTLYLDGVVNNARTEAAIVQGIRNRAAVASPLQIVLTGRITNGTLNVHVEITAEQAVNNHRLYIAMNEIYYRYDAYAEWWDHYDAMVKMVPDYSGTLISVAPNNPYSHDFEQSMDGLGWHDLEVDNLMLVAWVQDPNSRAVLQAENYQLGIDTPSLSVIEWELTDSDGNTDGRVEPGEHGAFTFTMENSVRYLPAENIVATLTTDDSGIDITNGEFRLDALQNGNQANNNGAPFVVTPENDFVPRPVTFRLSISAGPNDFTLEEEFTTMIGWPPFLLVDATNNGQAGEAMLAVFGNQALPWCDNWDRNVEGPMVDDILMGKYECVFWHGFNSQSDVISEFEADVLVSYLNEGGTLVVSSPFLSAELGNHALFTTYLAAQVAQTNVAGGNYVLGNQGDPHFASARAFLGGSMGWPTARMSFTPANGSNAVMHYENTNHDNLGVSAITHETDTYRTLFLGFPIEVISGAGGADGLQVFTARIWDWVQRPMSAGDDQPAPTEFALEGAFPNPFNSQTNIHVSMAAKGDASLKLFDLAGREVASLVEGPLAAGRHNVAVNASKLGIDAGVYFVRFEAAGQSLTSKVLYLK